MPRGKRAIAGFPDRIAINPEFFQRLDAKLDLLSQAGLLSAIAPLVELEPRQRAFSLSDDQVALLVRYMRRPLGGGTGGLAPGL